jgi:GNAT superfamily N-acetyltransferase
MLLAMDAPIFQRERPADLWAELEPLCERHRQEISKFKEIPLGIDKAAYERMDENGFLRLWTVRLDGAIIGYCACVVKENPHYTSSLQAHEDVLYVAPEYRKTGIGWRFLRHIDESLMAEGVSLVYRHVKFDHDHSPLLARMGYVDVDKIMARKLN